MFFSHCSPQVLSEFDPERMQARRKFKARCLHVHSRLKDISGCTSRLRSIHLGWTVRCGLEANGRSGLETSDPVPVCRKSEFALCFPEHHRSLSGERHLHLQSGAKCEPERVHAPKVLRRLTGWSMWSGSSRSKTNTCRASPESFKDGGLTTSKLSSG